LVLVLVASSKLWKMNQYLKWMIPGVQVNDNRYSHFYSASTCTGILYS
jgi:hypothetical protein